MNSSLTILGAGASGLLSALVLAPYYKDILLIDRFWPDEKGLSQGTPQNLHLHVLLAEGQKILSLLLPDVWRQLTNNCSPVVDWGKETWWKTPQGIFAPNNCGVKTHLFSRQWLNQILWTSCQQQQNIRTLSAAVNDWQIADRKIQQLHLKNGSTLPIKGTIIDARGRSSDLQNKLQLKSFAVKNTYRYYSTRLSKQDWHTNLSAKQMYLQACPKKQPIGFVLSPIENQLLILTLIDTTKIIKTDEQKQSIIKHLFAENQLGTIHFPQKKWHSYANLHNKRLIIERHKWPKNLLALGDSLSIQNPVYGHGLTIILKQMQVLRQQKAKNWQKQKQIHRCNWLPWIMASHQDRVDKGTSFQWLVQRLMQQAVIDPLVGTFFIELLHQKISIWKLFNPWLWSKLIGTYHD